MEKSHVSNFKITPPVEDEVYGDYRKKFWKNKTNAIVIDNGAHTCRAGWATEKKPRLTFRSLVGKPRTKIIGEGVAIGNDFDHESSKYISRSQYEQNIVTRFDIQEHIFDYIFYHLGIDAESIEHPLVLTEAVCNPNYCRKLMSELLFEAYQVPSVCYGIDAMFSYYYNTHTSQSPLYQNSASLIVSSGFESSHIIPIINNTISPSGLRRIPIGGKHSTEYLQKLCQLKYPYHKNALTLVKSEHMKETKGFVATDYDQNVKNFQFNSEFSDQNTAIFQLPFTAITEKVVTEEEAERKRRVKVNQGLRLKQAAEEKRKKKVEGENLELENLKMLEEIKDEILFKQKAKEMFENSKIPAKAGSSVSKMYESVDDVSKELKRISTTRERAALKRKSTEQKQQKEAKKRKLEEEERISNPEQWINSVKSQRDDLLSKLEKEEQKTNGEGSGARGSKRKSAAQERMRHIAEAAFESKKHEKEEKTFGENDDDWAVYPKMAKERQEDDSTSLHRDRNELARLEKLIEKYDKPNAHTQAMDYQIVLGTERVRCSEILFQPSLVGNTRMGIMECMNYVLNGMNEDDRDSVVQSVFLTGGNCKWNGFKTRIGTELKSWLSVGKEFKVVMAEDMLLDAWKGMALWTNDTRYKNSSVTRAEYEECGTEYLKQHALSNYYYKTT